MTETTKYPERCEVVRNGSQGEFKSKLVAKVPIKAGESVAPIEGHYDAVKRWSSVQIGIDRHIELNSELVYMNHSCDPSVHIDAERMAVIAERDLQAGDELTFFYPSTEWDMSQPFDCWCGAKTCVKQVAGAKNLSAEQLKGRYIARHIQELKSQQ
ncbi:hypothetical protein HDU85_006144 [Gaertneriomyces sp. JEL0708]|nr:hypothetical protein HDU85_006144 [Gaertneriomyces sp. JEL0708]